MPSNLKPLTKSSALRDRVYARLRDAIRSGRTLPGVRLQEIALAKALGVSRTPVREALALLANDGLVVPSGRGYLVAGLEPGDIGDIFGLRRLLEPAAVHDAANAATESGVAAVRAAVKKSETAHAAGDVARFMAANAEFRAAWFALVPNRRLVRAVRLYDDHVESLRVLTLSDPRTRLVALGGLVKLADAFAARDGDAAAAAMEMHLDKAEAALRFAAGRERAAS